MSKAKPERETVYLPASSAEQLRAAFVATKDEEGYASVSELIEEASMKEVRRLQRKYNQGKPWDALPDGALRRGRRTRDEVKARDTK